MSTSVATSDVQSSTQSNVHHVLCSSIDRVYTHPVPGGEIYNIRTAIFFHVPSTLYDAGSMNETARLRFERNLDSNITASLARVTGSVNAASSEASSAIVAGAIILTVQSNLRALGLDEVGARVTWIDPEKISQFKESDCDWWREGRDYSRSRFLGVNEKHASGTGSIYAFSLTEWKPCYDM